MLIAVSNVMNLDRVISYHSFNEGDKLCNKLKDQDCIEVKEGKLNIGLNINIPYPCKKKYNVE